jgi:hypothetical protein
MQTDSVPQLKDIDWDWGYNIVVEYLPSMYEDVCYIPSITPHKKTNKQAKKYGLAE